MQSMHPPEDRKSSGFLASWTTRIGIGLLVVGTCPLLAIILAAQLGLTHDPNPNPIGFGILAGITFWPAIILIVIGVTRTARTKYRA